MKSNPSLNAKHRQAGTASTWVLLGFAAVALFFLLTEHRAHLYGWLPYLLFAACPLMHLIHGHGSHGRHSGNHANAEPDRTDAPNRATTDRASPEAHQHH